MVAKSNPSAPIVDISFTMEFVLRTTESGDSNILDEFVMTRQKLKQMKTIINEENI